MGDTVRVFCCCVVVWGLGATTCGSAQQCPECPAVPESAPEETSTTTQESAGPGRLDRELIALAMRAGPIDQIRVRTDDQGNVIKLAVYHHDEGEIPEVVRQLAEQHFPGAEVRFYESEIYSDIGRVYEVEVMTPEGQEGEVSARADGTLVYVEREIEVDEIPAPIAEAVTRLVPNGEIIEAETKEGPEIHAVHVEVRAQDERVHYLRFTSSGELQGHSIRIPATVEVPVQ